MPRGLISCIMAILVPSTSKKVMLRWLRWKNPADYQYDIDTVEVVASFWRRGSVVGSWLLDLTADVLRHDPKLSKFDGGVSDSGEGRWTLHAAVDLGVPTPVISAALFERFNSRRLGEFGNKILNGMRYMFGGHNVR